MREDFCLFILTHGRPNNIPTLKSIKREGYTGKYYLVVDDKDKDKEEYIEKYGSDVILFNKDEIEPKIDMGDNFPEQNTVLYARNALPDIARGMGIKYYMELDDDYSCFDFRFNKKGEFKHSHVKDLDFILEAMVKFYIKAGITCLAFAQGGDFIGGKEGGMGKDIILKRKAMNTMLCSTDREFYYLGRMNDDVNAYIRHGQVGKLFFTTNIVAINQAKTQASAGGLTEMYLQMGTYVKSFYSVMFCPSFVKISKMGNKDMRIHHKIAWNHAVPCIINERYRK